MGGDWLQTMCAIGSRTGDPEGASSLERPTTSAIQAPPRFSAGLLCEGWEERGVWGVGWKSLHVKLCLTDCKGRDRSWP